MPLSLDFADRVHAFDSGAVGAELAAAANIAIIDTVGVTLLGSADPAARILANTPGLANGPGPCVVFGTDNTRSPVDAALLNGVASHAQDFDDFTQVFGGHPSVPVLPGLFALADTRQVSGAEFIAAYVAGVEMETRLAMGVHFHHYEKGWHPTATLGVFGAAAGCARLLNLDRVRTATALCIAASLSAGIKANFGTMTKPLHVGHCARNGLLAAQLAGAGFSANLDALEAPQGYLNVFNGPGQFDLGRMLDDWYRPPAVLSPGISIKQFPCCGSTHPAIYAALEVRRGPQFDPEAIRAIEVRSHPRRLPHTDKPSPAGALEAKFSIQYCVARALASGNVVLRDFEDAGIMEPAVRTLMQRLDVKPDASAGGGDSAFGARVSVVLNDGRRFESEVAHAAGRGSENPMSPAELQQKFFDCAARALPAERATALWDQLQRLETAADIRGLTAAAAVGGRLAKGSAV